MNDEKYYKDLAEKIEEKYDNVLVSKIIPYEAERKKLSRKEGIMWIITFFVIAPLVIYFKMNKNLSGTQIGIILGICTIYAILYFYLEKRKKNYTTKIKKVVMPDVCECFPDLKWIEKREDHTDLYKNTAVLPNYRQVSFDDYFEGRYENTDFSIEEVKIVINKNKFEFGVTSNADNLYGGIIISCSMNKKSKSHTIIHPFSKKNKSPVENLHYTKLEDVIFENNYNVYTDDDVEARYLITPSFMERINNIKTKFQAERMYVAFYDGNFYLMLLMSKTIVIDLFEPVSIFSIGDKKTYFKKMVEEIFTIYKLIDYFKLTQDIGM